MRGMAARTPIDTAPQNLVEKRAAQIDGDGNVSREQQEYERSLARSYEKKKADSVESRPSRLKGETCWGGARAASG
jgi:hypothetical protein